MLLRGIDNRVVDSASIEINRRARRAKLDGLDLRKLMLMLVRLKKEDKQHGTRIRSLLKLDGIRPQVAPGGRGWGRYLDGMKSRVRPYAWTEIERESRRLELVKEQIRKLEALGKGGKGDATLFLSLKSANGRKCRLGLLIRSKCSTKAPDIPHIPNPVPSLHRSGSQSDGRDQALVQTGALPIFSNKKSMKILTFAVRTFDFG